MVKLGHVQPEIAEIIGIKEALSWIEGHQWQNVIIETDSLACVQAINSEFHIPSRFGLLVHDCRGLLSNMCNVILEFVKRSANRSAHSLARSSCFSSGRVIQDASAIPEYQSIVMADIST